MIVMEDVGRHQGSFQMKNISFSIPDGYICGLVGRNGAGKTTLMHLLLGLYRVRQGKLEIDGMHYPEQEKEIHDEIGTVLVEELFDGTYSLWENGMLYGAYYSKFEAKEYEDLLQEFQLDKKEKFRKLSKGQKLKSQFAFALACHPKYLFEKDTGVCHGWGAYGASGDTHDGGFGQTGGLSDLSAGRTDFICGGYGKLPGKIPYCGGRKL